MSPISSRSTTFAVSISLALTVRPVHSAEPWAFGLGTASCRDAGIFSKEQLAAFVSGYWSAVNRARAEFGKSGDVGYSSEPEVIIGEVEAYCRRFPVMRVSEAIGLAYLKIAERERPGR